MVILLGGVQMIISEIQIKKLHGLYNYSIQFDPNLTFLYGTNGCGKTTVLNILASIVTGKLYNLVDYTFDEILVKCNNAKEKSDLVRITIDRKDQQIENMYISFAAVDNKIEDIHSLKDRLFRKLEDDNIDEIFQDLYPFVKKIKNLFNYVYLPLNRYGTETFVERDYFYVPRRKYYAQQLNPYNTYLNDSLNYISNLIKENCNKISVMENKINDNFRREVLSSSIQVSADMRLKRVLEEINNCDWNEVLKSKDTYVKTLRDIGVYDDIMKDKVNQFFTEFKTAYDDYQKKEDIHKTIKVDLAWQYAEFLKIEGIAQLAKKNERNREKVRKPKEIFLEVINDFFSSSETDKKIMISSQGDVYFKACDCELKLVDLSSGEKQIIITFASLIFGLEGKSTGIYIVDEPEASLHLAWQSKFVSSILKVNKNVQLIFATHSPELIGTYRENSVRLEQK